MPGTTGEYANLESKNRAEIPMDVFLPKGCEAVRPSISGTDIDGFRNVDNVNAFYEAKEIGVSLPEAQRRALASVGDFHIISWWKYDDAVVEHVGGYTRFAVPVTATISAHNHKARYWLRAYLESCGFPERLDQRNDSCVTFEDPESMLKKYVFKPTPQWLHIAWIADHYAAFLAQGKTVTETFPNYSPF